MSERDRDEDLNLFKMIDGVIRQINKTKKLFILMVLSVMVITPIVFAVTFFLHDPALHEIIQGRHTEELHVDFARLIPFVVSIVWLGIGIKVWFDLSKWTKRFQRYMEAQKELDRKLDNGGLAGTVE
jgi:NADH:ubiquinone oxidoreductase subunit 5 (subunit L)/multisubunit Na+/H+ antiporter MnhA subunit